MSPQLLKPPASAASGDLNGKSRATAHAAIANNASPRFRELATRADPKPPRGIGFVPFRLIAGNNSGTISYG